MPHVCARLSVVKRHLKNALCTAPHLPAGKTVVSAAKALSSLGGLCTGQSARVLETLVQGRGCGQLGYWVQRVDHESDLVSLVSPVENNLNRENNKLVIC